MQEYMGRCLPSWSAGLAKGIRLLAQEVQHPALKIARGGRGGMCLCVCLTEVAHLAGQLCNLIPLGENFFPISACDQILPWSIRLKCPCNFYPEERHTEESFSTSARGRKNGESSGVVKMEKVQKRPMAWCLWSLSVTFHSKTGWK